MAQQHGQQLVQRAQQHFGTHQKQENQASQQIQRQQTPEPALHERPFEIFRRPIMGLRRAEHDHKTADHQKQIHADPAVAKRQGPKYITAQRQAAQRIQVVNHHQQSGQGAYNIHMGKNSHPFTPVQARNPNMALTQSLCTVAF